MSEGRVEDDGAKHRRRRRWLFTGLGLLLVVLVLAGIKAAQIGAMVKAGKTAKPPPESVATAEVDTADWPVVRRAVGTLVAVRGVKLGIELQGTVREIAFEDGTLVEQGALLVRLDTQTEEAQLASAAADLSLAQTVLKRARILRANSGATQAELDAAAARAAVAQAAVANAKATISKKNLRAPFSGRIGIRDVELGQVVASGAPIASLESVDPIYVELWLPQQALADLRPGQEVRLTVDGLGRAGWKGTLTTIDAAVDLTTRNVRARATVPNPDARLTPGMFGHVEVLSGRSRPVLIIPATSVLYAPYGDSVYVLKGEPPALTVEQRFVRLGERRGDFIAVTEGLKAGETVVSSGAFKLHPGMPVAVNNAIAPPAQLEPEPENM